jgi:hypothetical protein
MNSGAFFSNRCNQRIILQVYKKDELVGSRFLKINYLTRRF